MLKTSSLKHSLFGFFVAMGKHHTPGRKASTKQKEKSAKNSALNKERMAAEKVEREAQDAREAAHAKWQHDRQEQEQEHQKITIIYHNNLAPCPVPTRISNARFNCGLLHFAARESEVTRAERLAHNGFQTQIQCKIEVTNTTPQQ